MVKNCCVPKCKSGLECADCLKHLRACTCEKPNTSKFSFHRFPNDSELRQKWIAKVHRKNNEKTMKNLNEHAILMSKSAQKWLKYQ